jgi:hypothetical protein
MQMTIFSLVALIAIFTNIITTYKHYRLPIFHRLNTVILLISIYAMYILYSESEYYNILLILYFLAEYYLSSFRDTIEVQIKAREVDIDIPMIELDTLLFINRIHESSWYTCMVMFTFILFAII